MSTHQYLRAHPEAEAVLEFIRSNPSGVTSAQVGERFPEIGKFDRAVITRKLSDWGFIRKGVPVKDRTVWVAV